MKIKKYLYILIVICFFVISGLCYYHLSSDKKTEDKADSITVYQIDDLKTDVEDTARSDKKSEFIAVHICGAVKNPDVYFFEEGTRIIEGVEAAGGFLEDAASWYLNLSEKMIDEQRIYIPVTDEVLDTDVFKLWNSDVAAYVDEQGRININTASINKLTELSGIGEKKAESIVKYREENGPFVQNSDIIKVNGISESLFQSIEDKITVQ